MSDQHKDPNKDPNIPDTTGHSWDGIEEYDNPLPRWWLWIFYATIVWGVIYTIAYPAWPLVNRATAGVLGFSTRAQVADQIAEAEMANAELNAQLASADLRTLTEDETLHSYAVNMGAAVYRAQCSQCHGSGAAGAVGFPNLIDDAWIWGGRIDEIAWTVAHGIRNEDSPDARWSQMPAFGADDLLSRDEINQVVQHVLAISGQDHDADLAAAGEEVFLDNCASCHGNEGMGSLMATREFQAEDPDGEYFPDDERTGAPNLTDAIWVFGGDEAAIYQSVYYSRFGVMPAWLDEFRQPGLTQAEVNAVAAYVHQLGGGEE
ncbi:cytochrome-c oxidase, cbb3-type subunit III [Histidinibacterium lentulum]|uniref:Cbb3-type cytochrome c oxidase subunit n=1 Tax=Histidinibacterium lentulum TaxID=2480588 RepID=A0A3N2QRF8_9RHOB|nr:cytochrome-c oxidase, cbb3-type subunit III [Histidinibacterium lentulum]ROT97771.1 cytochrome-c oxidase, cbb3-type subunit III [Histidinibacterium lentulum]